ncbi:hypothetical protein ES703_109324 [subsurface metagenome]
MLRTEEQIRGRLDGWMSYQAELNRILEDSNTSDMVKTQAQETNRMVGIFMDELEWILGTREHPSIGPKWPMF